MKPYTAYARLVRGVFCLHRSWLQRMAAMLVTLSLLGFPLSVSAATRAPPPSGAHVYLLRGVLNIFSLGLDEIAAKLRAQGIPVTVANFVSWSSLADEAAAEYKKGGLRNIILVGHSSGATALPDMVARLGHLGVPVKLAIGLDSVFRTKLAGHAERYINFYVASGAGEPVTATKDFHGALENVDVQSVPGVGHLSIDKSQVMQQRVISAIDAVVFSRRKEIVARHRQLPETSAPEQTGNGPEAAASARD
jgi:hypothetical protein